MVQFCFNSIVAHHQNQPMWNHFFYKSHLLSPSVTFCQIVLRRGQGWLSGTVGMIDCNYSIAAMFYTKVISITDRQFSKQIPFCKKAQNPLFKKPAGSIPLSIKTFFGGRCKYFCTFRYF